MASDDQIVGWSARKLHEGMKESIVAELARVMLREPDLFAKVFKIQSSLNGVDRCLSRLWKDYKSKNFMYLADPRDKELLFPSHKERSYSMTRNQLHGGRTDPGPEELDLRTFAIEACQGAWDIAASMDSEAGKPFDFMGLPAELRNMIYEYLFQGVEASISVRTFRKHIRPCPGYRDGTTRVRGVATNAVKKQFRKAQYDSKSRLHWDLYYAEFGNTVHKDQPKGISTSILRVSSYIHREAEPILYRSHSFDFGITPKAALAFYQSIPQAAIPFIPRIRFDLYYLTFRNEDEFCKTCNALIKLSPSIRLSTKLTFNSKRRMADVTRWPSVRALARVHGLKSLRSQEGKKFAEGFADLVYKASVVLESDSIRVQEILLNIR
ncbi:MAG: hypothetical protein Q9169_006609 [Polycauliona sp. 2 TL-2023]